MELLRRLEEGMEGAMGRVFGTLKRPLGTEALASAILRGLEENKVQGLEGAFAPNTYVISLSAEDAAALLSLFDTFSGEVRRFVKALARERGYRLAGPVVVRWESRSTVKRGEARVTARVASGQPRASFSVVQGAQAGAELPVEKALVTIGRASDNDVVIVDENVSRHHCELRFTGAEFEVADLGSTNGIVLNGQTVQRAALEEGDALELGRTLLKFRTGFRE